MKKERLNEIWGVLFLLIGLFALTSLIFFNRGDLAFYTSHPSNPVKNYTGMTGAFLSFALYLTFGLSAWIIPFLFLLWSGCYFLQRVPEKKFFKFIGLIIALFSASTIITLSIRPEARFEQGGVIGYLAGTHLLRYFGLVGSYILAVSCLFLSLLLATDFLIYPLISSLMKKINKNTQGIFKVIHQTAEWFRKHREEHREAVQPMTKSSRRDSLEAGLKREKPVPVPVLPDTPIKVKKYQPDIQGPAEEKEKKISAPSENAKSGKPEAPAEKEIKTEEKKPFPLPKKEEKTTSASNQEEDANSFKGVVGSSVPKENTYVFPSIDLLRRPVVAAAVKEENLQEKSKILEGALAQFGIEVKVVEVEQGPVITRYELLPAPGVKVNSIAALSDDLALAMKATTIRLIIPIPGKSAVGVEVPNSVKNMVCLRELVETQVFRSQKYTLPLALGKDSSGVPLITDLTGMPHLLIAGTTGSGKTVCVNSIIAGLLYSCSPDELKFVMIDPKMVELAIYKKIPHMLTPVVTDVRKAYQALNWVVNEMENRYKLLAAVGVRNIQGFNSRPLGQEALAQMVQAGPNSENIIPARLPYIVVIIDELADLMMVAQDKVEGAITRLAQLSRAVGIHLILATQRPSVDVITGVIKANFPARISFKVASKVDSRTVLDGVGADQLIGKGDMLFMQPGDAKPTRGQAALVMDEEINAIVDFVSKQAEPDYHPDIVANQEGKGGFQAGEKDELFDEAVRIVLETGQASTSNLQRRMRLGYTRAARIIDQMEAEGIVGPAQGAKPREILMSREDTAEQAIESEP